MNCEVRMSSKIKFVEVDTSVDVPLSVTPTTNKNKENRLLNFGQLNLTDLQRHMYGHTCKANLRDESFPPGHARNPIQPTPTIEPEWVRRIQRRTMNNGYD